MVATFSPHGDAGGTLHFPSPTHMRHVDTASAFRQLRRSLSRSPSKGPAFRLVTSKSASPSPSSPLSPSGLPSPSRAASASIVSSANLGQSPLAIPYPPSARKNWSGTRKPSPMRIASRSRSSQRSPRMSTLSDLSDHGNATSRSSAGSNDDAENKVIQSTSPVEEVPAESIFKTGTTGFSEGNLLPHSALAKFERNKENIGPFAAKSSPLKRSDGIMNFDQANLESPSAKRRSLHAAAFGPDFDIFDPETIVQVRFSSNSPSDGPNSAFPSYPDNSSVISPLPRRTSSLRRTTLQQRHDKPIFARSRFAADLTHDSSTLGQGQSKGKVRTSLDGFLPSSMARDSPFSSQASLPNASTHPVSQQNTKASNLMASRHPLSRTITQSSSNSSMAEDSPTHIPHRQPEHRRAFVDFSKSLPVGAARPGSRETMILNLSSHGLSAEGSFSTPENYKLAKPLPAAFMSTGLISKRHKDIDESQTGFQGGRSLMPDTPCKRHSLAGLSSPEIVPDNAIGKTRQVRHSFGTPSTPFSPHLARPAPGTFGKGVNIFGSNFTGSSINRRASFRSIDGDDHTPSLINRIDSQGSHDFDLPPTPTKQALHVQLKNSAGRMNQHDAKKSIFGAVTVARTQSSGVDQICKFPPNLVESPVGCVDGDSGNMMDESSSVALKHRSYSSVPSSFTRSRSLRNFKPPSPLLNSSLTSPSFNSIRLETKLDLLSPASPISERLEQVSPHTPRESMIPPDPSGLSISAHADGQFFKSVNDTTGSASVFPPATPTAPRDSFASFGNGRSSFNSSHNLTAAEVDLSLKLKFDKVELIGTGEFSHVYRVTKAQESSATPGYFSLSSNHGSPKTPVPDRVWAVKKSRHQYIGPKDRIRKLEEVKALKTLGQSDHTVHFFDSWEANNHLYIQTEFCEEGSLDLFLDQVGRKARLDDFRIWKIMLELSLVRWRSAFFYLVLY